MKSQDDVRYLDPSRDKQGTGQFGLIEEEVEEEKSRKLSVLMEEDEGEDSL